eukprot:504811-Hanusia_phi.AAC.5
MSPTQTRPEPCMSRVLNTSLSSPTSWLALPAGSTDLEQRVSEVQRGNCGTTKLAVEESKQGRGLYHMDTCTGERKAPGATQDIWLFCRSSGESAKDPGAIDAMSPYNDRSDESDQSPAKMPGEKLGRLFPDRSKEERETRPLKAPGGMLEMRLYATPRYHRLSSPMKAPDGMLE